MWEQKCVHIMTEIIIVSLFWLKKFVTLVYQTEVSERKFIILKIQNYDRESDLGKVILQSSVHCTWNIYSNTCTEVLAKLLKLQNP